MMRLPERQWILISLLGAVLMLSACTKQDGLYCDDTTPCTDPARPFCDLNGSFPGSEGVGRTCISDPNNPDRDGGMPDAEPTSCTSSPECGVVTPICVDEMCSTCIPGSSGDADCVAKNGAEPICGGDGQCHECTRSLNCENPAAPICDLTTFTCEGCDSHEQCGSGACEMETGRCVAEADVIHMNSGLGSDGPLCGDAPDAAACQHLGGDQGGLAKVQGTRRTIVMAPGNYIHDQSLRLSNVQVRIYGNGAHVLPTGFFVGPAIEVVNSSNLVIYDLVFQDGNGGASGSGIRCVDSRIETHKVTVRNNDSAGVSALGCDLDFYDTEIEESDREGLVVTDSDLLLHACTVKESSLLGIHAQNSSLRIERSMIVENNAGGLRMGNTDFILENTVIAKNGNKTVNPANFAGGVVVSNGGDVSPQIMRHCTVVDNESPNILSAAGIDCGLGLGTVACTSNIIVGNEKPIGSAQVGGNCNVRFSNVTGIDAGQGNISVAPTFVSPGAGDYHLAAGSAGIDLADPSSPTNVDIDNQSRPIGSGFDMGADERQ